MIPRLLNIQGIAGLAVGLALAILLVVQKGETRHWRKQSASFEQLYAREQTALATTVANVRARLNRRVRPTRPMPPASPPISSGSMKGHRMTIKPALPALALLLSACASQPHPEPLPVLAETRQCPAFPTPPAALLKPPAKTDFLNPTD